MRAGGIAKQKAQPPRNNKKYSTEQNFFVCYHHCDLNLEWKVTEQLFAERYPEEPNRTDQGLQSIFYRLNKECPVITDDKLLVFRSDPPKKRAGGKREYNEYNNKFHDAKVRNFGKVSLIDRYAEQIVENGGLRLHPTRRHAEGA